MEDMQKQNGVQIKVDPKTLHNVSALIRLPDDEFISHFDGKDFGYLCSMSNMVDSMYADAVKTKDALLKILSNKDEEEAKKIQQTVNMLYDNMFLLEHKFDLMKQLKEKRAIR